MPTEPPTPPPPPLRWGILGCARISRRGLIPGIQGSHSSTLVALASRNLATARAWATEFQIPHAYGSYQALLDNSEIQAIYIPLPNELHRPWVMAAADAGKHVLCDKPLAVDATEAAAMDEHCRARGVLLMEGFMWRHQPRTVSLRRLVAEGAVGELRLVRSSFSFPIDPADWRLDPARGGGALWDIGCYGVNTARLFAGSEPESVQALVHLGPTGVDISLTAELAFPNGVIGLIDCSFEQPFRCSYELVGSGGAIQVPDAYLPPERPEARVKSVKDVPAIDYSFDGRSQYAAMVDTFARSVAAGHLEEPAEDGLAQMRVLQAIKDTWRPV